MLNRFDYRKIRQLLLFAGVVEEKSLRKAADRLCMSLPPLTAQIDELESRLGLKLLVRTPRGVQTTPEGRSLMPEIQRVIEQVEMLDYSVGSIRSGQKGLVTVGAVMEAMLHWIPKFTAHLATVAPDISLFTKEIDSVDASASLEANGFDFAVGYFAKERDDGLSRSVLVQESLVVLLPVYHRLASEPHLKLADLSHESWVFVANNVSPHIVQVVRQNCRRVGFEPKIRHEVSSTMRQMAYVGCGQGLALVPEFYLCMLPPSVIGRRLTDVPPCVELCALWRPDVVSPVRDRALAAVGLMV